MKQFLAILISLSVAFSMNAQNNTGKLTITVNGNRNLQITIDGRNYNPQVNNINTSTISVTNLVTGQHTYTLSRTVQNRTTAERISSTFNLRYNYDMLLKLNENGSLELIETINRGGSDYRTAMNTTDFNALLRSVKLQRSANARRTLISNAFSKTSNYFTTNQAVQLIQQVNTGNFKLQLAKQSYPLITDRINFSKMYGLLINQQNRNELEEYVNNYNDASDDNSGNGNMQEAMSDVNFNTLYQNIQRQWPVSSQVSSLTNAFNNSSNYFSTSLAGQLIQIVRNENSRLQLAKLSYRSITDRNNFNQLYDLFSNQSSKDELAAYVNNYTDGNNPTNNSNSNNAMTDADFAALYQSIQRQWPVTSQMNSLTNSFNNSNNYFTSSQAKQLIQILSNESNRLQLAKLSYRSITDRNNFNQLYDLFENQSSKNELTAYVNNYSGNSNNQSNNGNSGVAMIGSDFTSLYQSIQQQFLPGERMNSISAAFSNTNYYFTSAQAKQLIQLIAFENNKLQLAKLSYRSITDRNNFTQLYDLFSNQSSKDELENYVRLYKD